ncbi:MAG: M48 family metallopeptidase [Myxococcaceae bacterium]|nr:M48 family metallopeptidase [Myxococcaceae bacterium]
MQTQKQLTEQLLSPPMSMVHPSAVGLSQASATQVMPEMTFSHEPVNAKGHVAQGTSFFVFLGYFAAIVGVVAITASTMGIGLIALLVGPIVAYFQARKTRARIRGSGIQLSVDQLPQLHTIVEQFSKRLGLAEVPETFIVEDAIANGFAIKLGKRNAILLTDDVVWGALRAKDPRAVGFVIAHELAHIALGHTGRFRSFLRQAFRPLARADEFSADNVATELVGDERLAVSGLTVLTVGPQLLPYVNEEALIRQALDVCGQKITRKAEKGLTHPLLLRRIGNVLS